MKKIILLILVIALSETKAQPTLWGTTLNSSGGFGTIFSVPTSSVNLSTQYTFTYTSQGAEPAYEKLVQTPNGKFYGVTFSGGNNGVGVLYEYDAVANIYIKKVDFGGISNGNYPAGHLFLASNGMIYGMTTNGGLNNSGILFEYNPTTSVFTKKIDFNNTPTGSFPNGALMQATNGSLYGMTAYGGTNGNGTLFEYNIITNTLTKHIDFNGAAIGAVPYGTLMQASNGFIYGLTTSGGTSGNGTLFQFDPTNNTLLKKFNFNGSVSQAKGSLPYGALVEASNGKLYGMAKNGGINNFGTLFEYNPANDSCLKKLDFNGGNGKWPFGSLINATTGKLYGMTWQGGNSNKGLLYQYDVATSTYSVIYNFGAVGEYPNGTPMQALNGKLYGVTATGGLKNKGVFFEFDLTLGTYAKKFDFNHALHGANPFGVLCMANNNKMYGLTYAGGEYNNGVLYEYDYVTQTFAKKADFNGTLTGINPSEGVIQAGNGKLYGLTYMSGTNNGGTIFEYDISTNTLTKKIDLAGASGSNPYGNLLEASNAKLYGLTVVGGTANAGVLFEYDPATNVYTKKIDFNGAVNGSGPQGSLMQASNGKLYGMTSAGGSNNFGTIFEYNITANTLTKKLDFNGAANGKQPFNDLVEAGNGKLYGLTYTGGINNHGVLFEFDPSNDVYTKKFDFNNSVTGGFPTGKMTLASNGKLYGNTEIGGLNNAGVLFEFDPGTSVYTKLIDYNTSNPANNLIEFCANPLSAGTITGSTQICSGSGATVSLVTTTVSGATSYTWGLPATASISAGAGSNSITIDVSTTAAGIYSITTAGTNTCGAGTPSQIIFTINPTPTLGINSGSICMGQSFTLQATGANSYTLQGGQTVVNPNTTTSYSLTGESSEGCIAASTVTATVTVNALPTLTATSNQSIICAGQSATLEVNGANTYTWSNAVQGNSIVISPAATVIYTVTGTDANGCEDTTQITQAVSPCTGIETNSNSENIVKLFPNPTSGKIIIESHKTCKLEIYNTVGELIYTASIHEKINEVDLGEKAKGLYYFKMCGGFGTKIFKVVKE
ncbi:MAG: C-terminal target protein [Bacteroidetes bacterium]|nr:C-terminal target protein [Bacteroidota bacterium]